MSNQYLRAFVIGSSGLVVLPYLYAVSQFKPENFNFDYVNYTFLAPISLGIMNLISLIIAKKFNLSNRMRYFLTSIIVPIFVLFTVILFNIYNYTIDEWINHIIKMYLLYFFVMNVILYNLDKYT